MRGGWRPSGKNPCLFVRRYKVEKHHERFLTPEELYRLGQALDSAPAERLASAHAAAAIRLLVLTGCRRNEILGLRWEDLDFEAGEMRLTDSKTGARVVPLPSAAAKVLEGLSRVPGNPWVFPGRKKGDRQHNINDSWCRLRERAGLDGVRLHDPAFMCCTKVPPHGPRIARYVGRSDTSLRERLMDHKGQYSVFFVRYADTPDEAFRFECEFYHRYIDTIENKIHPDRPDVSSAVCPICGSPDATAMVDSRLFGRG